MSEELEWASEMKKLAKKTNSMTDKSLQNLLKLYFISEDTHERAEIRADIGSFVSLGLSKLLFSERPVFAAPSQIEGTITIGTILQGDEEVGELKLPASALLRHIGIYAQTGHGKSVLLYNLMAQFIDQKIPMLFFDQKNDGRALLRRYKQLVVIPWKKFCFNPLRPPPGMGQADWHSNLSQICGYSFGWFVASSNYMLEHMGKLAEIKNPTMHDLYSSIRNMEETSRRRSEYHDVVENRIRAIISIFGKNMAVGEGIPIEKLLGLPVVLELSGLRPAEANWLVEVVLSWIYFYKLYNAQRGEKLRLVVIVDESHRIFDRSKEFRETAQEMGAPFISLFPTQFRDLQTSLCLTSQTPSFMMESVHANCLVKIVGNLSSGVDIQAISTAMGLDDEKKECIHKLKRGQWIVRMSDFYTEPFLIETPDFQVDKDVSDDEVNQRLNSVFGEYIPRFDHAETTHESKVIAPQISKDAWRILLDIASHPFRKLTTRSSELKLSWRKVEDCKTELIGKELVKEVDVVLGNYRPVKYLVPTTSSMSLLRSLGHNTRFWSYILHSGGGFEHRLHIVFLRNLALEAGYEAKIEKTLSTGRRVDLLLEKDEKKIGVEVQLSDTSLGDKAQGIDELDELVIVVRDLASARMVKEEVGKLVPPLRMKVNAYSLGQFAKILGDRRVLQTTEDSLSSLTKPDSGSFWSKVGEKVGEE